MFKKIKKPRKIVKIYLKSQKKPVILEVDKKELADEIFNKLDDINNREFDKIYIIRLSNFMFDCRDFMCAIYEEND